MDFEISYAETRRGGPLGVSVIGGLELVSSPDQTLRTAPLRIIGEGKMEGGSVKHAYYLVQLRQNVSRAN